MKKLLLIIGLSLSLYTGYSQQYYATNNLAASNHLVLNIPIDVQTITLYSTNTVPTLVYLYDGFMIKTNTAYTNYTAALTDVVSTIITSTGTTNIFTNSVWKTTANAVAAANTAASPYATIVVPANNEVLSVNLPLSFAQTLRFSNNLAGVSFVLQYRNR